MAESSSTNRGAARRLTPAERELLGQLLGLAGKMRGEPGLLDDLLAEPLDDGGMGSLRLAREGRVGHERHFGRRISEIQFEDSDGVAVIASLNLDQHDDLFELDVWKTDFSPTISLAARSQD